MESNNVACKNCVLTLDIYNPYTITQYLCCNACGDVYAWTCLDMFEQR